MHPVGIETRYLDGGSTTEPAAVGDITVNHTVLVVTPSGDGFCAIALPENAEIGDAIEVHITSYVEALQFHCPAGVVVPINKQFLYLEWYGGVLLRKIDVDRWGFIKSVNY